MAGGQNFPFEDLPESYFAGQKRITRERDTFPDLDQLLNSLRQGGTLKAGSATILNTTTSIAVVFGTAYPTGVVPKVVATPQADITATNSDWVDTISETGFTIKVTGDPGTDVPFDWVAMAPYDPS